MLPDSWLESNSQSSRHFCRWPPPLLACGLSLCQQQKYSHSKHSGLFMYFVWKSSPKTSFLTFSWIIFFLVKTHIKHVSRHPEVSQPTKKIKPGPNRLLICGLRYLVGWLVSSTEFSKYVGTCLLHCFLSKYSLSFKNLRPHFDGQFCSGFIFSTGLDV